MRIAGRHSKRSGIDSEDEGSEEEGEHERLLDQASHFCGYQEGRKTIDLRRRSTEHRGRSSDRCGLVTGTEKSQSSEEDEGTEEEEEEEEEEEGEDEDEDEEVEVEGPKQRQGGQFLPE